MAESVDLLTRTYRQQALLLAVAASKNKNSGTAKEDDAEYVVRHAANRNEPGRQLIEESTTLNENSASWHVTQHILDQLYRGQMDHSIPQLFVRRLNWPHQIA